MRQETRLGRGVSKAPEETTALSKAETPESSRRDSLFLSLDVCQGQQDSGPVEHAVFPRAPLYFSGAEHATLPGRGCHPRPGSAEEGQQLFFTPPVPPPMYQILRPLPTTVLTVNSKPFVNFFSPKVLVDTKSDRTAKGNPQELGSGGGGQGLRQLHLELSVCISNSPLGDIPRQIFLSSQKLEGCYF